MRGYLRRKLANLRRCTSGNALMLVGLGLPVLIGGAGFGVDLAQWYMWKRELQFAVDQAALAGAWAKASDETTVRATWTERALQEYNANLSVVEGFDGADTPTIGMSDYDTGTNNAVLVTSSATRRLPFSSLISDEAVTVSVRAKAIYTASADFHACMLALNESESQAFKIGGSVSGSSACGAGTLSDNDDEAMFEASDTDIPLGQLIAEGDIEDSFGNNGTVFQNQEGLSNPYAAVTAPDSSTSTGQTYPGVCPVTTPETTTYFADGSTRTHYTYEYYKGANASNWDLLTDYSGTGFIADSWSSAVPFTQKSVTSSATVGLQAESNAAEGTEMYLHGNGGNRYFRLPYTSTQDTNDLITSVVTPASDGAVHLEPGIYSTLVIECDTIFAPGVYFVSGEIDFGHSKTVTGTGGVMFVLTSNAGDIKINSDSQVTLSGITASTLINSYSYTAADAAKLAGMLIWDPDSTGDFTLNGNANLYLSGILYIPQRDAKFNGNGAQGDAAGNCIMVAADTIDILGNFSLANFCVSTGGSAISIGGTAANVRLVE